MESELQANETEDSNYCYMVIRLKTCRPIQMLNDFHQKADLLRMGKQQWHGFHLTTSKNKLEAQ